MDNLLEAIHVYLEGFAVARADFTSPRSEFIIEFFYRVLTEFEADLDHVKKYFTMGDCSLDNMCGLNVEILNLCNIVNYIIPSLNIGLFDILTPTPKRTYELVSKSIEFISLADDVMNELNEKMTEYACEKQKILKLRLEAEELRGEVNALAMDKVDLDQRASMLEQELLVLKQTCEELTVKDRSYQHQIEKMTNIHEKHISELEVQKIKLETLRTAIESLSGDVLESPEVYFEKIKVLEHQKAGADEVVAELEKKLKGKSDQKNCLMNDCKTMELTCKQLEDLEEQLKKYKEKHEKLLLIDPAGLMAAIDALNDEMKSISSEGKALELNISDMKVKKRGIETKTRLNQQLSDLRKVMTAIDALEKRTEDIKSRFMEKVVMRRKLLSALKDKCQYGESKLTRKL